ncbi:MAG TPA: STAS/SEC14 domain-containing protein [Blastocatellia bacterium]|nr:STAS/SEC14 domain-containing protein [Blastocatellia bacterium]
MATSSDEPSAEQVISAISRLSLPEIQQVFDYLLAVQAEHRASHLSPTESALLSRINQGLPSELRDRIAALRAKHDDESLTVAEDEELTRLVDKVEELHAERIGALCELAKLRGIHLPVLMHQLGIHFPENA